MTTAGSGLARILPVLVAASALGYAVQLGAPLLLSPSEYVGFSFFWSALFMCVSALAGVQNEVARAARPVAGEPDRSTLSRYALTVIAAVTVIAAAVGLLVADVVSLRPAIIVLASLVGGVIGFAGLALLTGALYGTRRWNGVAIAVIADPAIRAALFAVLGGALLLSGGGSVPGWIALLAVTVPFLLATLIVWLVAGRAAIGELAFDTDVRGLVKNSVHTLAASTALGFLVAGMPMIVTVLGADEPRSLVAGTVLLVVVVRAPLVSPVLALQSFLTVSFRDAPDRAWRRAMAVGGALVVATALLALAVALWADTLVAAVLPAYVLPDPWVAVAIVAGSGLVGTQAVVGAVVLSRSWHRLYAAGWLVTGASAVALAFAPFGFRATVAIVLTVPVVLGTAVHALGALAGRIHQRGPL